MHASPIADLLHQPRPLSGMWHNPYDWLLWVAAEGASIPNNHHLDKPNSLQKKSDIAETNSNRYKGR